MEDMNAFYEPGMLVSHPDEPTWGTGQVQSNINGKITVNFQEVGKIVLDSRKVSLFPVIETNTG